MAAVPRIGELVTGENPLPCRRLVDPDTKFLRFARNRRMDRQRKAVPEGGLDKAALREALLVFLRLALLGPRLGGEVVHEIRVDEDAGGLESAQDLFGPGERDALVHQLQEPVVGAFESAGDRNAARLRHLLRERRGEGGVEADVPPPLAGELPRKYLVANRVHELRRHRLVHEMEGGDAAVLGGKRDHGVDNLVGGRHPERADVRQPHVAERAAVPVAALRHDELDPLPRVPEVRDEVIRLHHVEVLVPVDAVVDGTDERLAARRVEVESVEIAAGPLVRHVPELGADVAAAEKELHPRIVPPDVFRDLERADEGSGERTRHPDLVRARLVHRRLEMQAERSVDHAAMADLPLELAEGADRAAEALGISREPELGVDLVADAEGERVARPAPLALRIERRSSAKELEELVGRLVAVFEENVADDLDREIALADVVPARAKV